MRPVPNQPLPWKGVFLVLLPGFVYLVAQIGQYMGKYWYLPVYYKAALYLMIPVVVVWIFKKQFPIWGLIPLGLLIKLLRTSGNVPLVYVENIAAAAKPLQTGNNFFAPESDCDIHGTFRNFNHLFALAIQEGISHMPPNSFGGWGH